MPRSEPPRSRPQTDDSGPTPARRARLLGPRGGDGITKLHRRDPRGPRPAVDGAPLRHLRGGAIDSPRIGGLATIAAACPGTRLAEPVDPEGHGPRSREQPHCHNACAVTRRSRVAAGFPGARPRQARTRSWQRTGEDRDVERSTFVPMPVR